jgi:hypothetical protein
MSIATPLVEEQLLAEARKKYSDAIDPIDTWRKTDQAGYINSYMTHFRNIARQYMSSTSMHNL